MKRNLITTILFFLIVPGILFAQRDTARTDFLDAESWFLFEEYAEALPLYMKLHQSDPGNDNFKYKIGICLLHDPYQKDKSIQYLLEASESINPDYKENSFKEHTAPPDVLYHLGNAYLVNELLESAIETFEKFLTIMDREIYDAELVEAQITACKNAQKLKKIPVDLDLVLLDSLINTRYAEINPVISGDGTKMAFVTKLPFYDGSFYTEKIDGKWQYPKNIVSDLGFDQDIYPACLSHDGTEMILYFDDEYIGNLYYSRFEEGRWIPAVKMNENINTKYWESHACFSRDGKILYFTSNRKGTYGGLDIYKSEKQSDGAWGPAENLGPGVNTRYNEETPFVTENGELLYFSSYGHFNMGGYDIFYSKRKADGTWGNPINLGYPINTTDDDLFFHPVNNGLAAYYSIYSNKGLGKHDIYAMSIYSVDNPRMYLVTGSIQTQGGIPDSTQVAIYLMDPATGDTIEYKNPDRGTGEFEFNLAQGIYELHFSGNQYEDLIKPLHITPESDKTGIRLPDDIRLEALVTEPIIFEGDDSKIVLKDSIYEGLTDETVTVPLRLEKGARLITRVFRDSVLISIDTMEVGQRKTDLELRPLSGTTRVELEMIDKDGNIHRNNFLLTGQDPKPEPVAESIELVEVDEMVAQETTALDSMAVLIEGDDPETLHRLLLEHATGNLKSYLTDLDLAAEGITTTDALIQHLKEAGNAHGFTMEDVEQALTTRQESLTELEEKYEEILKRSEGVVSEILEDLNLKENEINSVGDLIEFLRKSLAQKGYSQREIDEILLGLFGDADASLIREPESPGGGKGWIILPVALAVAGFLWLFIVWWRRRKKEREP